MSETILMTGGSGRLGQEILKLDSDIIAPESWDCDVVDPESLANTFQKSKPNLVLHLAAMVGMRECDENKQRAWEVNVEGTRNIAKISAAYGARLVFTSTAVVFDGKKGMYDEDDYLNPQYFYATTKAMGEEAVRIVPNYAIIRLDFFPKEGFKYRQVFSGHYTSKIPVDEAAQKVLQVARGDHLGVVHIGRPRETLYNILRTHYPDIKPIKIADSAMPDFPRDISLSLTK